MKTKPESRSSARESTDGSLRAERDKTDHELRRRRAAIERKADDVVDRARAKADEIVQVARTRADRSAATQTAPDAKSLKEARAGEDDVLAAERLVADEVIQRERMERKRALASLLRLEREETDERLLTERGRSDEALSTRDVLLAMVSHDLRTLLGGIALTAEVLLRDFPSDGDGNGKSVSARAQLIQRSTARMNRIIGDLVDIASIESGKLHVRPERNDLAALVEEAVVTFQLSAAGRGLALTFDKPGRRVPAMADHDRIIQVLANLLTNAIKFTPRGGRISVRLESVKDQVRVVVSDTGPGIPAEHLEAIFGRFWQVGRHDRRGLGLGLYISRCILDGHGGHIWAESAPGKGTKFFFTVPAA